MKQKKYYTLLFITTLLTVISCKEITISRNDIVYSKDSIQKNTIKNESISIKYSDSIFIGTYGHGTIQYNRKIKNVKKYNILERYILLYISIDENAKTFKDIEKTKQNEFIDTIGNGVFHFKYKFNTIGKNNLKLVFDDFTNYIEEGSNKTDTISLIKYSTPISLPVYVLDSSSIIGHKGGTVYFSTIKKYISKRKDSARILRNSQQKIDSIKRFLNKN